MGITKQQMKALQTMFSKAGLDEDTKRGLIYQYTNETSTSSKDLTGIQAKELIKKLYEHITPTEEQEQVAKMKNKAIALAHDLGWQIGTTGKIDMSRLNNWCIKFGKYKKVLDRHTIKELPILLTQFEKVSEHTFK